MKELLFPPIVILMLGAALIVQGIFLDKYQHAAEEALETAGKWQGAYTELQEDYSQAVERIEYLEHKLVTEPISEELKQEIENNVPREREEG